jgi:hypothetical protein
MQGETGSRGKKEGDIVSDRLLKANSRDGQFGGESGKEDGSKQER